MAKINLKNKDGNILYSCEATSYVDAIKQANSNGIEIKNLYISDEDGEEFLWKDVTELEGLSLEGLIYFDDRFLKRADNYFIGMNLKNSRIMMSGIDDGAIGYYDCDLRGAELSYGFQTTIEDCLIDKNTILPWGYQCDSYDVKNCQYEFENGKTMNIDDMKVCFTGVRDEVLEKGMMLCGIKVSKTLTKDVNVVITKDVNSTSSKIQKAKEKGLQIVLYEDFKRTFDVMNEGGMMSYINDEDLIDFDF